MPKKAGGKTGSGSKASSSPVISNQSFKFYFIMISAQNQITDV